MSPSTSKKVDHFQSAQEMGSLVMNLAFSCEHGRLLLSSIACLHMVLSLFCLGLSTMVLSLFSQT